MSTKELKITNNEISEYTRYLIDFLGIGYVDGDYQIYDYENNPITFGKNKKTIKIIHPDMKTGDYLIFNPFKELAVPGDDIKWFTKYTTLAIEIFIVKTMTKIMEVIVHNDMDNLSDYQLEYISEFSKDVTASTLNQWKKVCDPSKSLKILNIVYIGGKDKTSQMKTCLFDDDFREEFGKKVSGKTWNIIEKLFCKILNSTDPHKDYIVHARHMEIPKMETFLMLIDKILDNGKKVINAFNGTNIDNTYLKEIINNIEICRKAVAWLNVTKPSNDNIEEKCPAPWETTPVNINVNKTLDTSGSIPKIRQDIKEKWDKVEVDSKDVTIPKVSSSLPLDKYENYFDRYEKPAVPTISPFSKEPKQEVVNDFRFPQRPQESVKPASNINFNNLPQPSYYKPSVITSNRKSNKRFKYI
jgi:hypothetical protein